MLDALSAAGVAAGVVLGGIGVMSSGWRWQRLRRWQPFAFAVTAAALLYLAWLLFAVAFGTHLHLPSDPH